MPKVALALLLCACASSHPWLEDAIHKAADPRVQQALAGVVYVRYVEHSHVGRDAVLRCDVQAFLEFLAQTKRVLGTPDGPR